MVCGPGAGRAPWCGRAGARRGRGRRVEADSVGDAEEEKPSGRNGDRCAGGRWRLEHVPEEGAPDGAAAAGADEGGPAAWATGAGAGAADAADVLGAGTDPAVVPAADARGP